MQYCVAEPPVELLAATIASGGRILWLAFTVARWATNAQVEMIIVPVIGTDLFQPGTVGPRLAAQSLLDRRVDQDALDLRLLGRGFDDGAMGRRPHRGDDIAPVRRDHHDGRQLLAFFGPEVP